jgi:hypothetical protein
MLNHEGAFTEDTKDAGEDSGKEAEGRRRRQPRDLFYNLLPQAYRH